MTLILDRPDLVEVCEAKHLEHRSYIPHYLQQDGACMHTCMAYVLW